MTLEVVTNRDSATIYCILIEFKNKNKNNFNLIFITFNLQTPTKYIFKKLLKIFPNSK